MIVVEEVDDTVYINGTNFAITVTESDVRLITARDLDREGIKALTEALEVAERIHINKWIEAARERLNA